MNLVELIFLTLPLGLYCPIQEGVYYNIVVLAKANLILAILHQDILRIIGKYSCHYLSSLCISLPFLREGKEI